MPDSLRLGLVGTGWISTLHLTALERLGRTSVVGVVSRSLERASSVADRWGGTAHTDLVRMLEEVRPDVVYVCLPPDRAPAACRVLVERRIPFLTEKPLSATAEGAEGVGAALSAAARDGPPLVVAVGYQWRALDFLPRVRARLAERPARLVLARWTGTMPPPPWWRRVEESGGQVVEQATHLYDLARSLVGEAEVVAAASHRANRPDAPDANVDDLAASLLRFRDGAIGSFVNASISDAGRVELELLSNGWRSSIRLESDDSGMHWTLALDDGAGEELVEARRDPYEVQSEAFLDAVVAGDAGRVLCTYDEALRTDRLVRSVVTATGSSG